jgi:hypothetical protein
MRSATIAAILAVWGFALPAWAADTAAPASPQPYVVSKLLAAEEVENNAIKGEPDVYSDYDSWSIAAAGDGTFKLRTETCGFDVGAIPSMAAIAAQSSDEETTFRYGFVIGGTQSLLKRGLVSGTVPELSGDWSSLSVRRTKEELDEFVVDYDFAGMLSNPTPIAGHARAALEPACDPKATFLFLIGRSSGVGDPAPFIEIYEFYDVFSKQFRDGVSDKKTVSVRIYLCWMKPQALPDAPPGASTPVGQALLKAMGKQATPP